MGTAQMGHYISYCKLRRPPAAAPPAGTDAGGETGGDDAKSSTLPESRVTPNMFGAVGDTAGAAAGGEVGGEGSQGAEVVDGGGARGEGGEDELQWYCFDDDLVGLSCFGASCLVSAEYALWIGNVCS